MKTITGNNNFVLIDNQEFELDGTTTIVTNAKIAKAFDTKEELRTYIAGMSIENFPTIPAIGEKCEKNKVYKYGDNKVKCLQEHDRMHYAPEQTPALWTVIKTVSNYDDVENWSSNNWLAYQTVGYLVKYNNKIWASKLPISHTWIAPALTGNGAISWEFVADV